MRTTATGALIGSLSGGLLAYYLVRAKPWVAVKKVLAVAAGAAGGGAIGYGIAKIPDVLQVRHRMAGYPAYRSSASVLEEAALDREVVPLEVKRPRAKGVSRTVPAARYRDGLLQWTELVRSGKWQGTSPMHASSDVWEYFRSADLLPQEDLYVLMLDNSGRPLGHTLVSRGTQTQTLINPADALRPAVIAGATRVIAVHNHPSGDPAPSKADVESTKRLAAAGKEVGIELLDHVVIGKGGYASLRDMGLFQG